MADLNQFVQAARDAGYSGAEIQWHLMNELGYPPKLAIQATAPREKMGPPEAPRQKMGPPEDLTRVNQPTYDMPADTSFSEAMSKANPMPEWYQRADAAVNQPFSRETTGGPVGSLADVAPVIPQSKTEALLLAAGLIPGGKLLKGAKGALKIGTAALEGAAPEVGALSRGMALAGKDVLQEPPAGMVRLYRGSQTPTRSELSANPPLGEGERGRWFTTDPSATGFYGPHTFYVDVPQAVADAAKEPDTMLGVTGRLIPAEYANKERLHSHQKD